ncbi:hypothetical protein BDA96_10G079600 [Sorghum bicolor]|jgi:uncharacterized protein YfiM (DUF2279 family)|uniref:Uncharacterized protein n=2 Tax=Sorghum bicolor TaxID=4558 RepID=C5Z5T5_SORBI|nr:uncharacterized protein LOC8065422 [Sorghum bicolor]EER89342.1 hypothetical protein SORBI_3010G066500 [Sorghum bicolor]KAG0513178.1 hypothetical protein BDA96_10G079600 [Sorghum bicolor]|eukprot:XP_021305991.1 uncharacterized protein LOC8065422 [Sorghum bicolor]
MEWDDEWVAPDKLQHAVACLLIALLAAALAGRSARPGLRRRAVAVGSAASLAAGAAKEVADEAGLFGSAGASPKDAAADLLGVVAAALALALLRRRRGRRERKEREDEDARDGAAVSMV